MVLNVLLLSGLSFYFHFLFSPQRYFFNPAHGFSVNKQRVNQFSENWCHTHFFSNRFHGYSVMHFAVNKKIYIQNIKFVQPFTKTTEMIFGASLNVVVLNHFQHINVANLLTECHLLFASHFYFPAIKKNNSSNCNKLSVHLQQNKLYIAGKENAINSSAVNVMMEYALHIYIKMTKLIEKGERKKRTNRLWLLLEHINVI